MVHNDIKQYVMGCQAISSKIITFRQNVISFNIIIVQIYVFFISYSDKAVEDLNDQLQSTIDGGEKKDVLIL